MGGFVLGVRYVCPSGEVPLAPLVLSVVGLVSGSGSDPGLRIGFWPLVSGSANGVSGPVRGLSGGLPVSWDPGGWLLGTGYRVEPFHLGCCYLVQPGDGGVHRRGPPAGLEETEPVWESVEDGERGSRGSPSLARSLRLFKRSAGALLWVRAVRNHRERVR